MLSVIDPDGDRMFRHTLFYAAILVPVSIIPVFTGQTGLLYCIGALLVGCAQLWISQLFVKTRTHADAVKLLKASVFYLPTIFILILLDTRF